ncbi:hypothetical protein KRP22_014659 [Phytophthora ramorum]|nr:hypothetical protein KRP22_14435 [Phytophthora ramorum]
MRAPTNNPRVSPTTGTSTANASTATCSSSSSSSDLADSSIYVRAWRFVQRRLHLRPRASSCPTDMDSRSSSKTVENPQTEAGNSLCSDWQRVYLLKELEEAGARAQWRRHQTQLQTRQECIKETAEWTPTDVHVQSAFRTQAQRKVAQSTCYNCGLLFFRPLAVAPDTTAFCSRDCQSTFEYQRDLQDVVNEQETLRSPVNWPQSNVL